MSEGSGANAQVTHQSRKRVSEELTMSVRSQLGTLSGKYGPEDVHKDEGQTFNVVICSHRLQRLHDRYPERLQSLHDRSSLN